MTELFANITLSAVVIAGLLMIGGVIFVANMNDPRNAMHPGGRKGRMLDEVLVVGPLAPLLVMITVGGFLPDLRDAAWWFPILLGLSIIGFAASFLLPPVRRARKRVEALRKKAFS
ncbi:hypothetical protein [Brevundimonas sp. TWP2-3-2]|uniref:hypothetical protein n=1 Tax=unclassified Brevundimonas TaxID=2622653 RepID=UPI003CFA4A1A